MKGQRITVGEEVEEKKSQYKRAYKKSPMKKRKQIYLGLSSGNNKKRNSQLRYKSGKKIRLIKSRIRQQ